MIAVFNNFFYYWGFPLPSSQLSLNFIFVAMPFYPKSPFCLYTVPLNAQLIPLKIYVASFEDSVFFPDCSDRKNCRDATQLCERDWQWKTDPAQGPLLSATFSSVGTVLTRNWFLWDLLSPSKLHVYFSVVDTSQLAEPVFVKMREHKIGKLFLASLSWIFGTLLHLR